MILTARSYLSSHEIGTMEYDDTMEILNPATAIIARRDTAIVLKNNGDEDLVFIML